MAVAAGPAPAVLPTGGTVAAGQAVISQSGARMDITQTSQRAILNWGTFNIGAQAHVHFEQPGRLAVALNRVAAGNPSSIFGQLTATGQVFLVNPSGTLFGPTASVNVGGLVASTLDIANDDFLNGHYRFNRSETTGSILNQGKLTAADGGYIALLAPEVRNEGVISARLGTVALAAGEAATLDISGNQLLQVQVDPASVKTLVDNRHLIQAEGGRVILSARAADRLIGASINNGGAIEANSLNEVGGKIVLDTSGSLATTGVLSTSGGNAGGQIDINAAWAGLGGSIRADGASGGRITVNASGLSLADQVSARGSSGAGGDIAYHVTGNVTETSTSLSDASGATDGGRISLLAGGAVLSSGAYRTRGESGQGGRIDLTGDTVRLLSATLDASGNTRGGLVRVGGAFQGGRQPEIADDASGDKQGKFLGRWGTLPELANARRTFVNDTSQIDVSGRAGPGGTAIVWSDSVTTLLGKVQATGTQGGAVEISSAENLQKADLLNLHIGEGGHLLLDPKNIVVGDSATVSSWAYQAILGKGYAPEKNADVPSVSTATNFGWSVALNGDASALAVGAPGDAGGEGLVPASGAVRLFRFTDTDFSGGTLEATLGKGYTGGKNIDLAMLEAGDNFGTAVALNGVGNRLAVGVQYDDGYNNAMLNSGAVYLFTFDDSQFSNGALQAVLGKGYDPGTPGYIGRPRDRDVANLGTLDYFGSAVALNAIGDRLAVGAYGDDGGTLPVSTESGAVYLWSFDGTYGSGELKGLLGKNYLAGGIQKDAAILDSHDYFGMSVALAETGDRSLGTARLHLAVGAYGDDGQGYDSYNAPASHVSAGAVHLFSFADADFGGGTHEGTLGKGYAPAVTGRPKDLDVGALLDASDGFGRSVALSANASRLAVGAQNDDGAGNVWTTSGAVHLFSFASPDGSPATDFSGGKWEAVLGKGYTGGRNLDLFSLGTSDLFGAAVALNGAGNRLAAGAVGDDGSTDGVDAAGAAYLFSFTEAVGPFDGAAHQAIVGIGYTRADNLNVPGLRSGDYFGRSVALNAAGDRLAVGAYTDEGFGATAPDIGAVHLFSFTGANFNGGKLEATIGKGYAGGKNRSVDNLETLDYFGQSVALNAAGDRLVVGAYGDDGYNNLAGDTAKNYGAAYLFSFSDANGNPVTDFSGGALQAIIGKGYDPVATGRARDIPLPLEATDQFGIGVALNGAGNRLAVGAYADDGPTNAAAASSSGSVYLFSFSDVGGPFGGGTLAATLGMGYSGGNNLNVPGLAAGDDFGYSVALNAAGDRLAVGAIGDDGYSPAGAVVASAAGAIYLFSFSDKDANNNFTPFGGGKLEAVIGHGYDPATENYTGQVKDIPLSSLEKDDWLGTGVALNAAGNRLGVGAYGDDGLGNGQIGAGAVYLFGFSDKDANNIATPFGGGKLEATIGYGYTPIITHPKNLAVDLGAADYFGYSLALNGAGDRLAVGAHGDDGAANSLGSAGAVYLFGFDDVADPAYDAAQGPFQLGRQQAVLGRNYRNSRKDVDVAALSGTDALGTAVALNATGDRMALGNYRDDGFGNAATDSGAVFLYSFADTRFSGGSLQATLGKGYAGGKNVDVAGLEAGDLFGHSVALNGAGNRLAVGAYGDDGFGNGYAGSGAVHLFSFSDAGGVFGGGMLEATLGRGYDPAATGNARNRSVASLTSGDYFGYSVALNGAGDRLAVGAYGDDGADNLTTNAGAVYLFSFSGPGFGGGNPEAVIGKGYAGAKDWNLAGLEASDYFGVSVALNGAGNRLAAGALFDDGSGNVAGNSGAVHLFSFSDAGGPFGGVAHTGTLGQGYGGGYHVSLEADDYFGRAVALNAAGTRLAVGAYGDDGLNASGSTNYGAVHLFGFGDAFSSPNLMGTMGYRYSGGKNLGVPLSSGDYFGYSVTLNGAGNLMAVGVLGDDGYNNLAPGTGAIYLYSFTDGDFSGGSQQGVIGKGYGGGKNINVGGLDPSDGLGVAVALNDNGDRLAVGAWGDGGNDNSTLFSGAVRLFSFSDTSFSSGTLEGTVGRGYSGGKNVDVTRLEAYDYFGSALALSADGKRLAVGAPGDGGADNSRPNAGATYLFSFADTTFSNGNPEGVIGYGYNPGPGARNLNLTGLAAQEKFGSALALSADGKLLAAGAPGAGANSGVAYLIGFSDTGFSSGNLLGTLGRGASGAGSLTLPGLEDGDQFGAALALSADGKRLAVGAYQDDGLGNAATDSGAVYLFSFSNTAFADPALQAIMGKDYTGGKNVNVVALEAGDYFGRSVALNALGTRLAAGAMGDGGSGNLASYSGAVHLFGFDDGSHPDYLVANGPFQLGTLMGSVGRNYAGGKNVDLATLETNDYFGVSVALNAEGNRLAVGASGDDGSGNGSADTGAAYLLSFLDGNYSGGTLQAPLGHGYTGGKNVDIAAQQNSSQFGLAVALSADAKRLAVGAPYDKSADLSQSNVGTVRLFSFSDSNFSGGRLEATLGMGYVGGSNLSVAGLQAEDRFGYSVALSAQGNRLAVGAIYDSGTDASGNNVMASAGSVRLFSFTDASGPFGGGVHEATLGYGYTSSLPLGHASKSDKNLSLSAKLSSGDWFGTSVALNAVGDRLAVGAHGDDGGPGVTNGSNTGAVYLFSFSDGNFSDASHQATIGKGYTGGKNVAVNSLDHYHIAGSTYNGDHFGYAVALNAIGDRLAVGAPGDDGAGVASNVANDYGAVYLFSFDDKMDPAYNPAGGPFQLGRLQSVIGRGYTGDKNLNIASLDVSDQFGQSAALNGVGNLLAVGAPYDDGYSNTLASAGAVYLFSFGGTEFSGGTQQAILGAGYSGGKNVDVSALGGDGFGRGVAFNAAGDRLAVGAYLDDGFANAFGDSGAVYLFAATAETSPLDLNITGNTVAFNLQGGSDVSISSTAVAAQLSAGTAVTLQANNDITVTAPTTANNAGGNGGHLTLQAGRSVAINTSITTDNGDLTLIGNETLAAGVVDAFRQPGAASITQATGTTMNAGTGAVNILLKDGAGKTHTASGNISLKTVSAGTITVLNQGTTPGSGIALDGGLTASGAGNSLVLAGDRFLAGANAGLSAPNGRWLVYAESPYSSSFAGAIDSGNLAIWNSTYVGLPPAGVPAGSRYIFELKPTVTVASTKLYKIYGEDLTGEVKTAYTISGVHPGVSSAFLGDDPATVYSGAPLVSSLGAPVTAAAGNYSVDVATGTLTLLRSDYSLTLSSVGQLTVAPPPFVVLTDVKVGSSGDSKSSGDLLKLGDASARLAALAAADAARHEARSQLYSGALEQLKSRPNAADIPECGAGVGDVCIPKPVLTQGNLSEVGTEQLLSQLPLLPPNEIGRKTAILIGNTDYQGAIPKLETPVKDVEVLGNLLKTRMGYEVQTLRNATKADIVRTLKRLAETTQRDESVMVMYAGHGFQPEKAGQGYWIPVDAAHDNPERWISNKDISRILSAIPAKQVMLVSDSCFAGGLAKGGTVESAGKREEILSRRSVMVMTSGGEEPVSDEGKNGHSVFAYHLIKQLESSVQSTTLSQFFGSVKTAVTQDFPQEPQLGTVPVAGHMRGGDYLIDMR